MTANRHKVFISYYHKDDQYYKDVLINKTYFNYEKMIFESVFEDYSVRDGDIDDENLSSEQIRRIIRDEYIKDATVLILLCGLNTKFRKHVDWEIHAAMYDSDVNPQMGILIINLPTINQYIRAFEEEEKRIISNSTNWVSLETREQFEKCYPYMPERIIDNFINKQPITVVEWDTIKDDSSKLMILIDKAYRRRNTMKYDHSRPLRRRNS